MDLERPPLSFDRFTIDFRLRALRAGDKTVPLHDMTFRLLVYLVDHRAEARSRDRILKDVWWDAPVVPSNVDVQLSKLRAALRKAGCSDELIITLPRAHYRFIGEVFHPKEENVSAVEQQKEEEEVTPELPLPEKPSRSKRRLWWISLTSLLALILLGLAAILLPLALHPAARAEPAIVVVPWRNLSDSDSQKELPDAITDDLTTDLAHFPGLQTIARGTADTFRGTTLSAHDIGQKLHARYLLEGSIRAEETSYRINAQLIDTDSNVHLWAERFDTPKDHLADAQEAIVRRIASALHIQIDRFESDRALRERPGNPDAVDLFYRARAILDSDDTLAGFTKAQALLESAVRQEPTFTEALATLGWMLLRKATTMDDPDEDHDYAEAKSVIARARAAAPSNAEALAAQARAFMIDGKCDEAKAAAGAALAIEPSGIDARTVLAGCFQKEARLEEAADQYQAILRLDPESPDNRPRNLTLGYIRLIEGHYAEAIDLLQKSIAGENDRGPAVEAFSRYEQARLMLIAAYELNGDPDRASKLFDDYNARWPRRTTWRVSSYFPKRWTELPGLQRALLALQRAGMPHFSDEHASLLPAGSPCVPGDFNQAPPVPPPGRSLDTKGFLALKASAVPLITIDLGRGVAAIAGAIWFDPDLNSQSSTDFTVSKVGDRSGGNKQTSIVIAGDGPTGCRANDAAVRLEHLGFQHVFWYEGGEEAWFAANQPNTDERKR